MARQYVGNIDHYEGLGISLSKDNGKTWSQIDRLYDYGRHHPSLLLLPNANILMTYVVRLGYPCPQGMLKHPFFLQTEREQSDSSSSARGQVLGMPGAAIFRGCLRRAEGAECAGLTQGLGFARRARRGVDSVGCAQLENGANNSITNGRPRRGRRGHADSTRRPHWRRLTILTVTYVRLRICAHLATGAGRAASPSLDRQQSSVHSPAVFFACSSSASRSRVACRTATASAAALFDAEINSS